MYLRTHKASMDHSAQQKSISTDAGIRITYLRYFSLSQSIDLISRVPIHAHI